MSLAFLTRYLDCQNLGSRLAFIFGEALNLTVTFRRTKKFALPAIHPAATKNANEENFHFSDLFAENNYQLNVKTVFLFY